MGTIFCLVALVALVIFVVLLLGVVGFFGLHAFLWLQRTLVGKLRGWITKNF